MPYFRWNGVGIMGDYKKGKTFARSLNHLDQLLFARHIALLDGRPITRSSLFHMPIGIASKVHFFSQLTTLVSSGVLLPEALGIVADQLDQPDLQEVVHLVSQLVAHGKSLSVAMSDFPRVFDPVAIQLIKAGEDGGTLISALDAVCRHLRSRQNFSKRLRDALFMPAITLGFFFVVSLTIFVGIVPRFKDIFVSLGKQVPRSTRMLLSFSSFIVSWRMLALMISITFLGIACWLYKRTHHGAVVFDRWLLRIPIIGPMITQRFLAYFFESLALLLEGGKRVVPALGIIARTTRNHVFKDYVQRIEYEVDSGSSLSNALMHHLDELMSQDVIALVHVGQESGKLADMLRTIALLYQERLARHITIMTALAQPVVMILLGLLVAGLIFAVYMPIMNISSAI